MSINLEAYWKLQDVIQGDLHVADSDIAFKKILYKTVIYGVMRTTNDVWGHTQNGIPNL